MERSDILPARLTLKLVVNYLTTGALQWKGREGEGGWLNVVGAIILHHSRSNDALTCGGER